VRHRSGIRLLRADGLDVGALIGNLILAYLSQSGREDEKGGRDGDRAWILRQIVDVWTLFSARFVEPWSAEGTGDAFTAELFTDAASRAALAEKQARYMCCLFEDTLDFAGCKMIRRILGLADVADFESIADHEVRASGGRCRYRSLTTGRSHSNNLISTDRSAPQARRRPEALMKIHGKAMRTIWVAGDGWGVEIIDQTRLPFEVKTRTLRSWQEAASAIRDMVVRGAPLIGATGAYGLALAMREDSSDENLERAYTALLATRPTAVNLRWGLDDLRGRLVSVAPSERTGLAYRRAAEICDEDVETCKAIGRHGLTIIRDRWEKKGKQPRFNVLTHCNAGWLACIDWGTALAPIYMAFEAGIPVHVWVDETRPRNQGASLTAFELGQHGVDHTVIADNQGGHLMTSATRSAPTSRRWPPTTTACRSTSPCRSPPSTGRSRTASGTSRSRSATPANSATSPAARPMAGSKRWASCPRAARRSTTAST
jgi:hypothetical protein